MSEVTASYTTTVEATESKRQTLSLQDRFKVIDYLRGRVEPIIAATKTEAAAIVSEACGVAVTASQLWYMIDELPDYGLGAKFAIDVLTEPQEIMRRDIELLKKVCAGINCDLETLTEPQEIMRRDIEGLKASHDLELTRAKSMADAVADLLRRVTDLEMDPDYLKPAVW